MYSTLQRLQNVTSLATSFVLALLFGISLSSYLTIPQVELGSIEVNKLDIVPGTGYQSNQEFALLRFDLQADLSPLFKSWNTKQVYASITADYNNTKTGTTDSVVVWDRIITRKKTREAKMSIRGGRAKHTWKGPTGTFKNIPSAALTLRYDIMPYVGILAPGIAARARNPSWKGDVDGGNGEPGEWEFAMPKVKVGGVAR